MATRRHQRDEATLAQLRDEIPDAESQLREATAASEQVPVLEAERNDVQRQLDSDAAVRASDLLTTAVFDRVGARPDDPSAARLWDEAAGRLPQHQAAWGLTDAMGRSPQIFGDAYALSYRAAVADVERLDRALGRQPAIEPPSRSLGLSR